MKEYQFPIRLVALIGHLGLGGSERQLSLVLKRLDKSVFEPHVIVFNPSGPYYVLNAELEEAGVRVHQLPPDCVGVGKRLFYLYSLIKKISPHILHSWSVHDNPYAGVIGRLQGIPVIIGSMRITLDSPDFQSIPKFYQWLSLNSTSKIIVNSQSIVLQIMKSGVPEDRIKMIHNCAEMHEMDSTKKADLSGLGITTSKRIVGWLANIQTRKNPIMFIEVMKRILPEFPDVTAIMVGRLMENVPELHHRMADLIAATGLSNRLILTGFRADVFDLYRMMSIFCLTSDYEGLPNAIMEAMVMGLPVVATRVGGVPELVQDGVTGFLVEPGDVDGFARAVHSLLTNPAKAREMGQAGREYIGQYNCNETTKQFQQYYSNLLSSSPSSRRLHE